jgi:hypothetical protein
MTGLVSSLECGELRIARRLGEAERLVKEFDNMRMEARVNGK